MTFIPLAQGKHDCLVATAEPAQHDLSRYLSQPKRPMVALLNRQQIECQADGSFLYRSRPFQLLRYEIRPEVVFTAVWSDQKLKIVFQRSRLHGLGAVERAIDFRCEAVLQPCDEGLQAQVWAALLLAREHPMARLPMALRRRVADQALRLVFQRLERRCQGGLKRGLNRWLESCASAPFGNSSSESE